MLAILGSILLLEPPSSLNGDKALFARTTEFILLARSSEACQCADFMKQALGQSACVVYFLKVTASIIQC